MTFQPFIKPFIALGLVGITATLAQGRDRDAAMDPGITITVEGSYLQETVDFMLIRQQSRAETREMKLLALEHIRTALDQGISNGEVVSALEYMALEGIVNKIISNSRVRNNYPDIRRTAAAYLGDLGTPQAHRILLKMSQAEYEPMVLTAVVTSLTKIGITGTMGNEERNEILRMITRRIQAFDVLVPDNLLALAALEAYEAFARQPGGTLDSTTVQAIERIAEGRYHGAIRERAKQILTMLRTYMPNPLPEEPSG
ncbi:MAG: HEAT repeat domain-containing protein [Treponema sp.]|jgi:hypothetical protein|nr:HEAT repeat domain-containing protein [Treponema sp.]